MKKFNKIIALTTAIILVLSMVSFATMEEDMEKLDREFAEEVDYIESIYKYDLSLETEEKEEETKETVQTESLKYGKAVGIIDALGLIKKNSLGFFREDELLSVDDYAKITEKLIGFSDDSESSGVITHITALRMVMRAAGYDYLPTDAQRLEKAYRLHLLDGISYGDNKSITRGEMAQLLYNVLNTDVVELASVSGSHLNFETTDDATLMQQLYGYVVVEGLVTGANGIDIYTNRTVPENKIEIDRHEFWYNEDEVKTGNLFGHRVYGLVDVSEDKKLVFVEIDAGTDFVTVSFDDIIDSGSYISWKNESGSGKVKASNIHRVVLNGVTYTGNSALSEVENGEGTISFTKSSRGNYDIAIINKYETYKVNRYSERDKKLYFDDGRKFGEYNYIDAGDDGYEFVNVMVEGEPAEISDVTGNHIVSIFTNGSNFIQIEATTAAVEGKISQMYDDKTVVIGEKSYTISPSYKKAIESGARFKSASIGMEAVFRLNVVGNICYVGAVEEEYKYAVIKKIGAINSTFNSTICVRMFDERGKWVEAFLADKVTIDGKKYTDQESAARYIEEIKDDIATTIIRYKLNSDKKITFLDTINPTSYEADDIDSMKPLPKWEGKIEWNKGKTLLDSSYKLKEGAMLFYVPSNVDDEDLYTVTDQGSLVSNSKASLVLYNPDKFLRSKLAIFSGESGSSFDDNFASFLVTKVRMATDEQGRNVFELVGLDSITGGNNPYWEEKTYKTTYELAQKNPDIKPGHLMQRALDANRTTITNVNILMTAERAVEPEKFTSMGNPNAWDQMWCTVKAVSSDGDRMVLVSAESKDYSFKAQAVGIFDCKTNTGENVEPGDVMPGDKVMFYGNWASGFVMVYRNVPAN